MCKFWRFYFTRIISFIPVYNVAKIDYKNFESERSCWHPFSSFVIAKYLLHWESFTWLTVDPEAVYFLGETSLENLSSYPTPGIYFELIPLGLFFSPCYSCVMTFSWIQEDNFYAFLILSFFSIYVYLIKGWCKSSGHPSRFFGSLFNNPFKKFLKSPVIN